jgi:hypothetical protein
LVLRPGITVRVRASLCSWIEDDSWPIMVTHHTLVVEQKDVENRSSSGVLITTYDVLDTG